MHYHRDFRARDCAQACIKTTENRTVDQLGSASPRRRPKKHRGSSCVTATSMLRVSRSTNSRHIRRYFQRVPINRGTCERASERVAAARNGLNRERKEIGGDEGCARDPVIRANRRFPARAAIAFSPGHAPATGPDSRVLGISPGAPIVFAAN